MESKGNLPLASETVGFHPGALWENEKRETENILWLPRQGTPSRVISSLLHAQKSAHLGSLLYLRVAFSCSCRLRMLQKTRRLFKLKIRVPHAEDVPEHTQRCSEVWCGLPKGLKGRQAKNAFCTSPLKTYLLFNLLKALNLLPHTLLEFLLHLDIFNSCFYSKELFQWNSFSL